MSQSVYVPVIKLLTDRQTTLLISLSCMVNKEGIKQSRSPQEPWSIPGTYNPAPPLTPEREAEWTQSNYYKTQSTLIEKRNFYNFLHRYPPLSDLETITQPAKTLVKSGVLTTPSHSCEEAEWTQKVITGAPSSIQFPLELPRLLNEKTFPNSRS
ncbi:hypothetical protein CEXT_404821 [Caerostris extrusa]|uniref:Uncharacterized protein n=1 Tax=Caerostris extrusa TaxID=172846 RepID=A0AAV4NWG9_CAEEX|nr:hypothetical protein CEXT_404821 [Caerostris extrusa]